MKRSLHSARLAFSLIELLVVIGIVALLIGILLPVLANVRESAKAAACMVNMRSIASATSSYMLDNKQFYPQPSTEGGLPTGSDPNQALWYNALDYYFGNEVKGGGTGDRNDNSYKQDPVWNDLPSNGLDPDDVRTIKMNEFFGWISSSTTPPSATGTNPYKFFKSTRVPLPSKTVLYGDGRAHDTPSVTTGNIDSGGAGRFSLRGVLVGLRHQGGANLVMADISVSYHTNPIRETGSGYQGWYENSEADETLRPDVIFDFDDRANQ
ncbi:MAG: type II secretion system protein [Planctomycetota bacterium]